MTVCGDRLLPPGHYTHCSSHRTWARLNCSLINTAECRDGTAEMGPAVHCRAVCRGCVILSCCMVPLPRWSQVVVTRGSSAVTLPTTGTPGQVVIGPVQWGQIFTNILSPSSHPQHSAATRSAAPAAAGMSSEHYRDCGHQSLSSYLPVIYLPLKADHKSNPNN